MSNHFADLISPNMTAEDNEGESKLAPKRLESIFSSQLKSQGNIYTFKSLPDGRFAIGLLQRKMLALNPKVPTAKGIDGKKVGAAFRLQELLPLSNYLSASCEIISIEVFVMDRNSTIVGKKQLKIVSRDPWVHDLYVGPKNRCNLRRQRGRGFGYRT